MTSPSAQAPDALPLRVVVVGAGISGLCTAHRLARDVPGLELTVLEASARVGGKIRTRRVAGLPVDTGPDAFLARAPELAALVDELGLRDDVEGPAAGGAYVWSRGRMRRLPPGAMFGVPERILPLLRSRLLSFTGTARAGLDLVKPRTSLPEDPSVGQLLRPRLGDEVFDRLVQPLIGGVHAGDADRLSARSAVPEVAAMARSGRSLVLTLRKRRAAAPATAPGTRPAPPLVSLRGGMSALTAAIVGRLGQARLVTGAPVRALRPREDGRWSVVTDDVTYEADHVVLAVPAHAAAPLLSPLAPSAAEVLAEIPYVGVANVTLALASSDVPDLPPDGTGFLVPPVEGELVVGCSWLTSKWPHLVNDDVVLMRCLVGRAGDDRFAAMDDDALVAAVRETVARMLGVTAEPLDVLVQRWPAAMPQYVVGHAERLERLDLALTEFPTLHLTGAAYRGVGLAGCVAQGTATAARIVAAAAPASTPAPDTDPLHEGAVS